MVKFSEMTDEELKDLAVGLHSSIYIVECFSAKDLQYYDMVCAELVERDYVVNEEVKLVIS